MIGWLPPDSAYFTVRRVKGDIRKARQVLGWNVDSEMLQAIRQDLQDNTFTTAQVQSPRRLPTPKPAPHPVDKPKRSTTSALAIGLAVTQQMRQGQVPAP